MIIFVTAKVSETDPKEKFALVWRILIHGGHRYAYSFFRLSFLDFVSLAPAPAAKEQEMNTHTSTDNFLIDSHDTSTVVFRNYRKHVQSHKFMRAHIFFFPRR